MLSVKVNKKQFECGLCHKEYSSRQKAEECFDVHKKAIEKLLANLKPGVTVLSYFFNDSNSTKVPTTIVKIKGELIGCEILLESENGSRWWVRAIRFCTGNSVPESIQNKPTNFWLWNG